MKIIKNIMGFLDNCMCFICYGHNRETIEAIWEARRVFNTKSRMISQLHRNVNEFTSEEFLKKYRELLDEHSEAVNVYLDLCQKNKVGR